MANATVINPADLRQALTQVRSGGYSLVEDELEDGLVALAIPLRDADGVVIAAINLCTYSLRTRPADLVRLGLPLLRETAAAIEAELRAEMKLSV